MAHTQVQKLIATRTNEDAMPEKDAQVAKMMGHTVTRRRNCYVQTELTKTAAAAMRVVERLMQPSPKKISQEHKSAQEQKSCTTVQKMHDPHGTPSGSEDKDQESPNEERNKSESRPELTKMAAAATRVVEWVMQPSPKKYLKIASQHRNRRLAPLSKKSAMILMALHQARRINIRSHPMKRETSQKAGRN